MKEKKLKSKIEQLSDSEIRLLSLKVKNLIQKEVSNPNTENNKKIVAYLEVDNPVDFDGLKLTLKNKLPDYMIPSAFYEVKKIPLLPNGKVDKKELLKTKSNVHENVAKQVTIVKPTTEIEEKLIEIWEEVLDCKPISTHDNFFEIGGDSILSIQIIAKARNAGISIAPNQLFEHQTISELALFVSLQNETTLTNEAMVTGPISLTPIQTWFFDTHKKAPEYWNQAFKIKELPEHTNQKSLIEITKYNIQTHDALRLSFHFENGNWNANVLKSEEIEAFLIVDISNEIPSNYDSKIEGSLKEIQESIKLDKGSLFKCIYFYTGINSSSCIVLLAHHLVIDLVSWQIILNSYTNTIYDGQRIHHFSKTASIKTWENHLQTLANSKSITNELEFWKRQVSFKSILPKDSEGSLPILEKDISVISFEVNKELTQTLINKANNIYNTKVEELLLTALNDTLSIWTDTKTIPLSMERHGRETINTDIDLSHTVGWFTSFFPIQFNFESTTDIASKIIATKEQVRKIPNGGIGYGILRYLNSGLDGNNFPEIVFNFLGKQNTIDSPVDFLSDNVRHPLSERQYYLEINALIKDEGLIINWSYSNKIHKAATIQILIDNFIQSLNNIIAHCINAKAVKYTPSDFDDVDLDQDDLDTILDNIDF